MLRVFAIEGFLIGLAGQVSAQTRALWATGHRDQALLEYRLAFQAGSKTAWEEVAARTTSIADLLRVAGDDS